MPQTEPTYDQDLQYTLRPEDGAIALLFVRANELPSNVRLYGDNFFFVKMEQEKSHSLPQKKKNS